MNLKLLVDCVTDGAQIKVHRSWWPLSICRIIAPHSGQSSHLVDANDGNAQFLPKLAGAVAWNTMHKSFKKF
jgi:hypothetical protein